MVLFEFSLLLVGEQGEGHVAALLGGEDVLGDGCQFAADTQKNGSTGGDVDVGGIALASVSE